MYKCINKYTLRLLMLKQAVYSALYGDERESLSVNDIC
jgi:hypothetical protein